VEGDAIARHLLQPHANPGKRALGLEARRAPALFALREPARELPIRVRDYASPVSSPSFWEYAYANFSTGLTFRWDGNYGGPNWMEGKIGGNGFRTLPTSELDLRHALHDWRYVNNQVALGDKELVANSFHLAAKHHFYKPAQSLRALAGGVGFAFKSVYNSLIGVTDRSGPMTPPSLDQNPYGVYERALDLAWKVE